MNQAGNPEDTFQIMISISGLIISSRKSTWNLWTWVKIEMIEKIQRDVFLSDDVSMSLQKIFTQN